MQRTQRKTSTCSLLIGVASVLCGILTEPGDLVLDPLAGSNTAGEAAQLLKRHWISCDLDREKGRQETYVRASAFRFEDATLEPHFDYLPDDGYSTKAEYVKSTS